MIYKRYEISRSLNGDTIMHIARNATGNVVFRESSEEKLIKAIDMYLAQLQKEEGLAGKKQTEEPQHRANGRKRGKEDGEQGEESVMVSTETVPPPPQARITRGPDGKFISKSQFQNDVSMKKKTFWDKIKG